MGWIELILFVVIPVIVVIVGTVAYILLKKVDDTIHW
jgi:hypothetical protein